MFKHGGLNHFDWSSLEKRQGENLYPSHEDTFASISFFELSCLEQFVACVGRLLNSLWGLSSNHSQITGCGINALWKKDWLQNIQKRMPFIWDLWWERRQNKKKCNHWTVKPEDTNKSQVAQNGQGDGDTKWQLPPQKVGLSRHKPCYKNKSLDFVWTTLHTQTLKLQLSWLETWTLNSWTK